MNRRPNRAIRHPPGEPIWVCLSWCYRQVRRGSLLVSPLRSNAGGVRARSVSPAGRRIHRGRAKPGTMVEGLVPTNGSAARFAVATTNAASAVVAISGRLFALRPSA